MLEAEFPGPLEAARLQALADHHVLDTAPEEAFDRLTSLAADLFDAPIALVSLIDAERQWFKSRHGLQVESTPRSWAFCSHAIEMDANATMVVEDAARDARFANNPLVTGHPDIRFYAGAVLTDSNGFNLGTLCIIDDKARPTPSAQDIRRLEVLARMVVDELELRRATKLAREQSHLLALAEQLSGVGHWRYDIAGQHITWSDEAYRIHGVTREHFAPDLEGVMAFCATPDDEARARRLMTSMLRSGGAMQQQLRIRRPDGRLRHLVCKVDCLQDEAGTITALYGVYHDVTAQKTALRKLRQEQQTTAAALRIAEEQARRADLAESVAGLGRWRLDIRTNEMVWSDQMFKIYGLPAGSTLDMRKIMTMTHPDDLPAQRDRIDRLLQSQLGFSEAVTRVYTTGGDLRFLASNAAPELDESGALTGLVGTLVDVTERKRAELALAAERELLEVTLHSIADGVISTDDNSAIRYINPAAERMLGLSCEQAQGRPFTQSVHLLDKTSGKIIDDPIAQAIARPQSEDATREAILHAGRESGDRPIQYSVSLIRGRQDQNLGAVMVLQDLSEIRILAQQMSHLAQHDALTNLPNRVLLHDRVRQAIVSGHRENRSFGIAYLDLDGFKRVNDELGHAAGDELLKMVAGRLKEALRASDTICRLGGDEFVILLNALDSAKAAADIARGLVTRIAEPFPLEGVSVGVSVSVGLSMFPRDGQDTETLMRNADSAMYRAKTTGKNRVQMWRPTNAPMKMITAA